MRWLEFIKIRTLGIQEKTNVAEILSSVHANLDVAGLVEAKTFSHSSYSGDRSLSLLWEKDELSDTGSELALSMVRELKNHGLVDHSVWLETNSER